MVAKNEQMDALSRAPMFGGLDDVARAAVALEMREANYDAGQVIFSRGDPGTDLHVVVRGRVRLSVLTADGRELSFAHAEPPSIFGELAVFDGRPRSADATAVSKVVTLTLSKAAFSRLLSLRPEVGEAAIRFLSARLR
ncbi:MAG: cyclic nucleotide-binding domain-containing protein, partial [Hyphomicrobium sp.]